MVELFMKINVVPEAGLEPASLAAADFESHRNPPFSTAWFFQFPRQSVNKGRKWEPAFPAHSKGSAG